MSATTITHFNRYNHLAFRYLESIAIKQAGIDAGLQSILSVIERIVHLVFNNLLYVCYPAYKEFYHERQIEIFQKNGKEPPPYVNSNLLEGALFIHRFILSPSDIGALFPSSSGLINAMTRKIDEGVAKDTPPRRYLDIGAGTGSFTSKMVEKMRPEDVLDVVEYDPELCVHLQKRFRHLPNVHIHNVSIFDFAPPYQYDVIVTGLPLNNFSSKDVERAFEKYVDLTREGGSFSYFEYMLLPTINHCIKRVFSSTESVENFRKIRLIKHGVQENFSSETDPVYWNMTPARAIHCKKGPSPSMPK